VLHVVVETRCNMYNGLLRKVNTIRYLQLDVYRCECHITVTVKDENMTHYFSSVVLVDAHVL